MGPLVVEVYEMNMFEHVYVVESPHEMLRGFPCNRRHRSIGKRLVGLQLKAFLFYKHVLTNEQL